MTIRLAIEQDAGRAGRMGSVTELPGLPTRPDITVRPRLTVRPAVGKTKAVVLVLPGGSEASTAPTSPRQLPARRMRPFAIGLHRAGRALDLAAWTVHYRYRGWNGEQASPLPDIGWALDQVREQHGDVPVVLLGHSMGGRAALRMAGDRSVRAVAAFAPWLPDGEPEEQLAGRRLLIAHGSLDRVTSPRTSRRYADRALAAGVDVSWRLVRGDTHAMLIRFRTWQRLAVGFTLDSLT
jgi:alpha-beta hydrolase superfamily lysophospholipase